MSQLCQTHGCGAPIAPRSRLEPSRAAPHTLPRSDPSGHVPRRPLAASGATMWAALPGSCSLSYMDKTTRMSSSESARLRRARSAASKTCGRTGREHCFRTGRCAGVGQQCSSSCGLCTPDMRVREHAQNGARSWAAGGARARSLGAGEARGCTRQATCERARDAGHALASSARTSMRDFGVETAKSQQNLTCTWHFITNSALQQQF